jgi:hypothetical protein
MKRTITILGCAILMISCNNNESKMKSGIKEHLNKNANDPKSYEFVELKILDTVTVGEINKRIVDDITYDIERAKEDITYDIERAKKDIIFQTKLINILGHDNLSLRREYELEIEDNKSKIKEYELEIANLTQKLNATKKDFTNKEIVGYVAYHKFRLKNGFGALDLSKMFVEFDKDFNFLEMDNELNYSQFR